MLGRERSWARKWLGTGGKWHLRKRKGGKAEICKRACCHLNNENCFHVVIVLGEQGSEMRWRDWLGPKCRAVVWCAEVWDFSCRKQEMIEDFSQTLDLKKKKFWWQHEGYPGTRGNWEPGSHLECCHSPRQRR